MKIILDVPESTIESLLKKVDSENNKRAEEIAKFNRLSLINPNLCPPNILVNDLTIEDIILRAMWEFCK